jgi:hypothetical protein
LSEHQENMVQISTIARCVFAIITEISIDPSKQFQS